MSEATQVRPTVRVEGGALVGKIDHDVPAFLGIPYAAPPFGPNRMQPPQPAEPWDGERDASEYGPTAPKGTYPLQYAQLFPEVVIPGEDCLNLNVWTPDPQATGLPVVVYPNSGQTWDGAPDAWRGDSRFDPAAAPAWYADGARLIGGCCGVGPPVIAALSEVLAGASAGRP